MRSARDQRPDFSKLVWMAKRRGPNGRAALQVFQDALMTHYERQFESAVLYAQSREGYVKPFVVFRPDFERKLHKFGYGAQDVRWPFVVRYGRMDRDHRGVVVWSATAGFNVSRIRRVRRQRSTLREGWRQRYGEQ